MHAKIFRRYALVRPPFHNRVLRSMYDIPKDILCKIIGFALKQACTDEYFIYSYDGFEQGIYNTKKVIKASLDSVNFEKLLLAVPEGGALGICDSSVTFYMRCSLEPSHDVSMDETQGGMFEFYGADTQTLPLYQKLKEDYDGFFLMESAKKHLDEIMM